AERERNPQRRSPPAFGRRDFPPRGVFIVPAMSTSGTHAALFALLAIALTATCAQTQSTALAKLEAARALWASNGSSDYTMRYQLTCHCHPDDTDPFIVTVQGGVVIDVVVEGSNRQPPQDVINTIPTVEGMFNEIERGLSAGYAHVGASYDPATGAPVTVYFDYNGQAVDDEVHYSVRILDLATGGGQALPGPSPPLSATATDGPSPPLSATATGGPSPPLSATATGGPSPPLSATATGELLPQSEGGAKGDEEEDDE
ncbi:unnamed protein product, partial [Ostreobium quekettii]